MYYPELSGAIPPPRFDHAMSYMTKINSIVISGGRTYLPEENFREKIYNDLYLFLLEQKMFIRLEVFPRMIPRFNHSMITLEDKI